MIIQRVEQHRYFTPAGWLKGAAVLLAILLAILLAGCGGSGGGSDPTAVNALPSRPQAMQASSGSFATTSDNYGMENPTYLSAVKSSGGLVLRAAVASSMTDPDFRTVTRIDVTDPAAVTPGRSYALGSAEGGAPAFPGEVYFFNGHQSTLLKTVGGTISFDAVGTNPGDMVSGSFSAVVMDGNDSATPKASYTIAGKFRLSTGGFGPIVPAASPVPPLAISTYDANCSSCHSLGTLDPAKGGAPDLALKGGKLEALFPASSSGHKGVSLASPEIAALKVLLNAN